MRSGTELSQFLGIFLPTLSFIYSDVYRGRKQQHNNNKLAIPRWFFCFGSLVILDVACGYICNSC